METKTKGGFDKMNELCLGFGGCGHIYFSTKRGAVDVALMELRGRLDSIGVNIDNMSPKTAILRDSNGLTIEEVKL